MSSSTSATNHHHHPEQTIHRNLEKWLQINEDWMATSVIYGHDDETTNTSTTTTEIRPLSQGVCASLVLELSVAATAFAHKATTDGDYRYYTVQVPPKLKVQFKYLFQTTNENNDNDMMRINVPPTSVTLQWEQYPRQFPPTDKKPMLLWLWKRCNQLLQEDEDPLSYTICEYCQHEALSEYYQVLDQQEEYRLIVLPDRMDRLYHDDHDDKNDHHHGILIHPKDTAYQEIRLPPKPPTNPMEFARLTLIAKWHYLYEAECPICFDGMRYSDGVTLPCHHFVCRDCFGRYLKFKVDELAQHRTNPFLCPVQDCRQALPIVKFVQQHIPKETMTRIRTWYKDLKFPPCFALDRCLSKACGAQECMRRLSDDPNTTHVFCDECQGVWCELCLKRIRNKQNNNKKTGGQPTAISHEWVCDEATSLLFCQRYLLASDKIRKQCQDKYPWIVSYAHARQHDNDAQRWILQHGQSCPTCHTGVERIEGCFHMQCPSCATHFCYECGEELFPPYYGTHHCWERAAADLEM